MDADEHYDTFDKTYLEKNINITYLETEPEKLNWDVDLGKDYIEMKDIAVKGYKLKNKMTKYNDKIKTKIVVSHYIYRCFEQLKEKIEEVYNKLIATSNFKNIIDSNNPLTSDFADNIRKIADSYQQKIIELQEAWYEDWKNYGDASEHLGIEEELMKSKEKASERQKIIDKYKKYYIKLANAGDGDENTNPLKWWIKYKAIPAIDETKKISAEAKDMYINKERYNEANVSRKLADYLDEVNKLPNNNLYTAYLLLEQILDYVGRFGKIDYKIYEWSVWKANDRIASLKIENYDINPQIVKEYLIDIYNAFGKKLNSDELIPTFVPFAHTYSSHFTPFTTVNGILFELYVIRQNGKVNRRNFTIEGMINEYERYKLNHGKLRVRTQKLKEVDWLPSVGRMGKAIARAWRGDNIEDLDKPTKATDDAADDAADAVVDAAGKIGTKLGKLAKPILEKAEKEQKKKEKQNKIDNKEFNLFDGMRDSDIGLDANREIDTKETEFPMTSSDIDSSLLIASDAE